MSGLKMYLFGLPQLERNDAPLDVGRRKAIALLAYMAVARPETTRPVYGREAIATLLWPESDPSRGRANLSRIIVDLNKALDPGWSSSDRDTLALNPDAPFWVDVVRFQRLVASAGEHEHPATGVCDRCLSSLDQAAALYKGDFMTGFTLPDSSAFDEWQLLQAERLRHELANALRRLVEGYGQQANWKPAVDYARRWVDLDPLHEPTHRALMTLYAQSDQRAAALAQYEACRRLLSDELGVEPSPDTQSLYEAIRIGEIETTAWSYEGSPAPAQRFAQETLLATGGHGEVYRGRDMQTGEMVVIKRLRPEVVAQNPDLVARFAREGEALSQLNHPNIVKMLATIESQGQFSIVMEYVASGSLRDLLDRQPQLTIERTLDIGLELADALSRAHHLDIVHRDIKPGNVLLAEDGSPRLTDFGLARLARHETRLTNIGTLMGSPAYMSPEVLQGDPPDARSDMWSFGVMLYEMVAGRLPFAGEQIATILARILNEPVPDISQFRQDVPAPLINLLQRLLVKEPDRRLASMRQVAADLEAIREGNYHQPGAGPDQTVPPTYSLDHALPPFLMADNEKIDLEPSLFVAREGELGQLEEQLEPALSGSGRIAFIMGEAGRGKTTLLTEFARRIQGRHESLVMASGTCNAFSGAGDPYLPFRDIISTLLGDIERGWKAGSISREQAIRLWRLLPHAFQVLLDIGQDLIGVFVPRATLTHAASGLGLGDREWQRELYNLAEPKIGRKSDLEQRYLFDKYAQFLSALSIRQPLLLLLDDLQWADGASINLLFHLGRRLANSQILIVGAYRPSEVALGRYAEDEDRHPLATVVNELKRQFGDIQIDLGQTTQDEGRAFVDAFLDGEPNQLDEGFREALFEQTNGHPLFTIELLRDMQARGDLILNDAGQWVEGPTLMWNALPARVEAVIAQRISRLDQPLQDILTAASVEGEVFTAQVVARVQRLEERPLLHQLSGELARRHRLVQAGDEINVGERYLSRYKFGHALFQQYLYSGLTPGERRLLHAEIARALEELYEGNLGEVTVELAHHYLQAGNRPKAIEHTHEAASRAESMFAYKEAIQHLNTALALFKAGEKRTARLEMIEELADIHVLLGEYPLAVPIYQEALGLWLSMEDVDKRTLIRLHRKIGEATILMTWLADYEQFRAIGRANLEKGLKMAQRDPDEAAHRETIRLLTALSGSAGRYPRDSDERKDAEKYALAAVEMAEGLGEPVELSAALGALSLVFGVRGMFRERVDAAKRRLTLSRDPHFSDVREQASVLIEVGASLLRVGEFAEALPYLQEAEMLSKQIQAHDYHLSALRQQTECFFRLDRWAEVLAVESRLRAFQNNQPGFFEHSGSTCFLISIAASTCALRGEHDRATRLREEATEVMTAIDGPQEGWARNNRY
jgi:serine/threonine protein kinase